MTKKRYILSDFFWEVLDSKYDWFGNTEPFSKEVIEEEDYLYIGRAKTQEDGEKICNLLNKLTEENGQLKQSVNNLKDTIIKITIAYQRKYDRTIVDLVDEVHEEDITDLIKELEE